MTLPDIDRAVLHQARKWVGLLASGAAGAAEIDSLKEWLAERPDHARAFERERGFWQDLEPHRSLFAMPSPAPAVVPARRRIARHRWPCKPSRSLVAAAVAASLALAMIAPDMRIRLRADHVAGTGEVRTVSLPDRSTAMLDTGAAIAVRYDVGTRRIVLLRGRAWFAVAHGDARPFRVMAGDGVIEDVGTAFEVDAGGSTGVAVSQGAVRVSATPDAPSLILRTGQRARYHDGGAERLAPIAPDRIAAWRTGELLIDDMPLGEAVALAARYRKGPTLVWADLSTMRRVSGVFSITRADDAVIALATNAGVRVSRLPTGAMILY